MPSHAPSFLVRDSLLFRGFVGYIRISSKCRLSKLGLEIFIKAELREGLRRGLGARLSSRRRLSKLSLT